MSTPAAIRPAPDWLRELAAARGQYEELFGWPVSVDVEPRRLVALVGGVLDTVTMPGALGEQVLTELQLSMSAGPVVADPSGGSWTFLTQPTSCCELPAELHQAGLRPGRPGACAIIPTSPGETGQDTWRWIERPRTGRALPPWSVVIDTVRRIAC
jgi:hypothetical protein